MSDITFLSDWREKRENSLASEPQSMLNTSMDEHGLTATDLEQFAPLVTVVAQSRVKPFTTKSDFARLHADFVAICAVEGFITTRMSSDTYTNHWMITQEGLEFLEAIDDVSGD